ncbi:hypothetical protein NPIL_28181 [Nephila pilipes]|uniref:Uncharacterized protein n=1 Tax=Nephila pilipes TaxID=299642 RepID=A0A8X6N995_NEPPI|nr:hypothetical protein NPIL_28181 [Nephila pilipes]
MQDDSFCVMSPGFRIQNDGRPEENLVTIDLQRLSSTTTPEVTNALFTNPNEKSFSAWLVKVQQKVTSQFFFGPTGPGFETSTDTQLSVRQPSSPPQGKKTTYTEYS